MSTNHTPEPWQMIEDMPEWPQVSTLSEPRYATMTFDDYRRAVACVNACAGINPEAVPDVVAAFKPLLKYEGLAVQYMGGMGNLEAERNTQEQFTAAREALAKLEDVG